MFKAAKTLQSAKPSAKSDKAVIEIASLGFRAGLKYLRDVVETVEATIDERCKAQMTAIFVKDGCGRKAKPGSFKGYENISRTGDDGKDVVLAATASCEFRKRSTASAVSPEEKEILDANGIEVIEDVKVVETFAFSPELVARAANEPKVAKAFENIEAAIRKIIAKELPGVNADEVIVKQEKVSKWVVTDKSVEQVFCKPADVAEKLLPLVSTLAIKPTVATDDINAVWPFVQPLLGIVTPEQVREFQAKKDSKRGSFKKAAA
jgi:hypothetical protein